MITNEADLTNKIIKIWREAKDMLEAEFSPVQGNLCWSKEIKGWAELFEKKVGFCKFLQQHCCLFSAWWFGIHLYLT